MKKQRLQQDLEPACFYLRKSREDQEAEARGEGETLAKHKKALFRLAKENNVKITTVFEEIVSGESVIHRPEMMQLLKEVGEGKWKSVWCMEVDRLGRGDMEDQGLILKTFKNSGTYIVTQRKIYDLNDEFDEEYTEFEAFMARKELKIITRRLQGGRIRSVQDGNYIGTRPPYGYQIEKKGRDRMLVPHPEQAPVVKLIFELYTNDSMDGRMGAHKIAAELNRMGKKTYSGRPWASSMVLNIIKNEVYIGRLQWKKKESKKSADPDKRRDTRTRPREEWIDVEGKHEPLVSKELFAKTQAILKGKYHVPYHHGNGITNPLAGLVKCDICGSSMVYRPYKRQQYPHLICYNPQCSNKSSRFEYIEKQLLDGLEAWVEEYQNQWSKYQPQNKKENTISIYKKILHTLEKELATLGQQKDRLPELLERRIYDEATYLERSQKLSKRVAETEKAIADMKLVIKNETKREKARKDIIPKFKKSLSVFSKTKDPAAKNRILKSVLEYATYRKEKDQRDDDFTLVLYPRLPQ
ncbi:recombinase family protein [Sporomusa acidovorans]|uniref:Recombinase n=1 Tax=Sporomusa acidovorans (strain ATCC 49682 / DSM 3132 / Mol) TaxID=1123286 RepID=A0ABZ3J0Y8_SPOA4|nr:recombinase family protein [Sporomusa acidovorans]OZC15011.1 recombinase [Sporomusa acidovorans DSM 3132]SDE83902.1 Site-specific DNA recombinase [Sporomusa acidovorans]